KVLVAYEGSDRSQDALALGRALVAPGGEITAACSYWYEPRSARVGKGSYGDVMRSDAETVLRELPTHDGERLRTTPAPGPTPAWALHDLLEDGDYDLVVVGSTHRGRMGRALAGTTAERLLHGSPCPVAVAPLGYRDREPRAL